MTNGCQSDQESGKSAELPLYRGSTKQLCTATLVNIMTKWGKGWESSQFERDLSSPWGARCGAKGCSGLLWQQERETLPCSQHAKQEGENTGQTWGGDDLLTPSPGDLLPQAKTPPPKGCTPFKTVTQPDAMTLWRTLQIHSITASFGIPKKLYEKKTRIKHWTVNQS